MRRGDVAVLGATSFVGQHVCDLLLEDGTEVVAMTRGGGRPDTRLRWCTLGPGASAALPELPTWISVAPIWTLPQHFTLMLECGARRVVALSSTSLLTKQASNDPAETETVRRLAAGERALSEWGTQHRIDWVLVRPTLIYGGGADRNVSEIARVISRLGFFPLVEGGTGLRQPIHAGDAAKFCIAAARTPAAARRIYVITGGETLSYREMVSRVFVALGRRPLMPSFPLWAFSAALRMLRLIPRLRHWSPAMAARMTEDLVFNWSPAERELGVTPRRFTLTSEDLPSGRDGNGRKAK